ncbi:hypothetical protein NL676_019370 [Syzygium grande]|nr:hypothetical protein NL676_019370 [Syzygium grande]
MKAGPSCVANRYVSEFCGGTGEKWTDGVGAAGFVPCRPGRSAEPVRSGDRERSEADCVRVLDVNGLGREDLGLAST